MSCVCYVLCGGRVSAALAPVGGRQPSGSASVQVVALVWQPMQILTKFDGEVAPRPPLSLTNELCHSFHPLLNIPRRLIDYSK